MKKKKLAYILASSHSGSTLLAMLLGAHPEVCTVGELKASGIKYPDLYRCSCGELVLKCKFWENVSKIMRNRGFPFNPAATGTDFKNTNVSYLRRFLRPVFRGKMLERMRDIALSLHPKWSNFIEEVQARNVALVETLLDLTGSKVLIDTSKQALRLKYLLRNPSLDVLVIRMMRDGRGVILTNKDEGAYADAADPDFRAGGFGDNNQVRCRPLTVASHDWRVSCQAADRLIATIPKWQWIKIHYEELCTDPVKNLRSICNFLGVNPNRINLNFRAVTQHVMGNGMRFDTTSEIKLDERWRKDLTPDDLMIFDQLAADLNRSYGYF